MTEELKQLREALRRVKHEAASLADAQVIALEALTQRPAAQADDWRTPTTYAQRFAEAVALLCREMPPADMVAAWIDRSSGDHSLQDWACERAPAWAQGIGLLDAAHVMADQPTEGVNHEPTQPAAQDEREADEVFLPRRLAATQKLTQLGYRYDSAHGKWLPATQQATPEPVGDVRCEGCGYMTHHREHMGCVRAAKQHTHPAPGVPEGSALFMRALLQWAVGRWQAEVQDRPMVNKNRRTLDDTWRQVIRFAGGNPDALVGPSHDDMLAAAQAKGADK